MYIANWGCVPICIIVPYFQTLFFFNIQYIYTHRYVATNYPKPHRIALRNVYTCLSMSLYDLLSIFKASIFL